MKGGKLRLSQSIKRKKQVERSKEKEKKSKDKLKVQTPHHSSADGQALGANETNKASDPYGQVP